MARLIVLFSLFCCSSAVFCCAGNEEKGKEEDIQEKIEADNSSNFAHEAEAIFRAPGAIERITCNVVKMRIIFNLVYMKSVFGSALFYKEKAVDSIGNFRGKAAEKEIIDAMKMLVNAAIVRGAEGMGMPMEDDVNMREAWMGALEQIKDETNEDAIVEMVVRKLFFYEKSRNDEVETAVRNLVVKEHKKFVLPPLETLAQAIKTLLKVDRENFKRALPEIREYYLKEIARIVAEYADLLFLSDMTNEKEDPELENNIDLEGADFVEACEGLWKPTLEEIYDDFSLLFFSIMPDEIIQSSKIEDRETLLEIDEVLNQLPCVVNQLIHSYILSGRSCIRFFSTSKTIASEGTIVCP